MLELLHIENIAVIEEADIQFHAGFNALTGETGAGKSIVIDAMGTVLGGRTSRELVRTGKRPLSVQPFPLSQPICLALQRTVCTRMRMEVCCCSGRLPMMERMSAE